MSFDLRTEVLRVRIKRRTQIQGGRRTETIAMGLLADRAGKASFLLAQNGGKGEGVGLSYELTNTPDGVLNKAVYM